MSRIVDILYRRSNVRHRETYCTLPGGFDDEVNWQYHALSLTPEELAPIEAVLFELMPPTDKRRWVIHKYSPIDYEIRRFTWKNSQIRGRTPEELAQSLKEYYKRWEHFPIAC